jgi:hypothetical protein
MISCQRRMVASRICTRTQISYSHKAMYAAFVFLFLFFFICFTPPLPSSRLVYAIWAVHVLGKVAGTKNWRGFACQPLNFPDTYPIIHRRTFACACVGLVGSLASWRCAAHGVRHCGCVIGEGWCSSSGFTSCPSNGSAFCWLVSCACLLCAIVDPLSSFYCTSTLMKHTHPIHVGDL